MVNDRIESSSYDERKRLIIIKSILNSKNAFLNISMDDAYAILTDLGISETAIKSVYEELIDLKNYKKNMENSSVL
jgi:hypothetical protein